MSIRIYTMTHKKFEVPPDDMYVPLQVGCADAKKLGYLEDNTGDHISELNCYYSELTGIYWIWKNIKDIDYVGTCHYRRYLINRQEYFFGRQELEQLLAEYDLITTKKVQLLNSYYNGFSANHNKAVLDETGRVIRETYPEYYETFVRLVNGKETYFGNIMICKKTLFDEYADWLFTIFFEVQKRVDLTAEDQYHKRVFGFISEFLLYVFAAVRQLKVYECKVGMLGEKAETRELKEQLAGYFKRKDVEGAKKYFLSIYKIRPDVLMEASDITGELKLSMQVIATCEQEQIYEQSCILDRITDFSALMHYFSMVNKIAQKKQEQEPYYIEELQFIKTNEISETAMKIAELL
ncbi:MAG TPA: DUF4422 domain-containing protein, partial [Lachnospiraceae bacterium]|nr:DUF4422 domain-containing protein [Lachnospiraceae bacterium]